MKTFQGRVVTPGCAQAEALVTHGGLNTLASFQKSLQFGDKTAKCGDQNNPDLYGKPMAGKALCLPQTIGSTTGGLVLYCACAMDRQPACMLFANPIDSLAAAGAILADVWLQPGKMPVVDSLGEEFLSYVKDGMTVTIGPNDTQIAQGLQKEAELIRAKLPKGCFFCVLTPEGKLLSSEQLADTLRQAKSGGRSSACFLIGSSFGIAPELKKLADLQLSMSKMTFPHHLARVMALEQLYRAEAIQAGSKYHK